MDPKTKHAMGSVLEDMGRAAREGRARRYREKLKPSVDVTMGDLKLEPTEPRLSEQDMKDLDDLSLQH